MGTPAQPTTADRAATRYLARRIVESVENDYPMAHGILAGVTDEGERVLPRADAEQVIMQLAQEIALLRGELKAIAAARDESVAWLMETVPPSIEAERRIAKLRKVGAK